MDYGGGQTRARGKTQSSALERDFGHSYLQKHNGRVPLASRVGKLCSIDFVPPCTIFNSTVPVEFASRLRDLQPCPSFFTARWLGNSACNGSNRSAGARAAK